MYVFSWRKRAAKKEEEKRKHKEKEKLKARRSKSSRELTDKGSINNDVIVHDKKEKKRRKQKGPKWHCTHCKHFNSSSKITCIKCSLHRRPLSTSFETKTTTIDRSDIDGLTSEGSFSPPSSSLKHSTEKVHQPKQTIAGSLTKSVSLVSISDIPSQDKLVARSSVKQLLHERQQQLAAKKAKKEKKPKKGGSATKEKKPKKKKPKKKKSLILAGEALEDMRESYRGVVSTGSNVYAKHSNQICPFHGLPFEMMLHIFSFMEGKDLCAVSETCKCWYEICKEPMLWKVLCLKEVYVASPEEWVDPPPWRDDWKEYYKHFIRKWEMDASTLKIINFCGASVGENYKVYQATFWGMKVFVRAIRSVADIEEFRFTKELKEINTLHSDHIADVIGTCRYENNLCVIMPFYERGNLLDILINEDEKITWGIVLDMCEGMLKGVKDLHDYGLIHKNLSPSSFLVDNDWNAYLSDYVNLMNPQSNMKVHKERNFYAMCAPEIYLHDVPFSRETDVFSLGMVFWHLVQRCATGEYAEPYSEYPYIKFGFQTVLLSAKYDLRPTISAFCPPFFATLITKCWDKDPRVRPSISELLLAIESLKEEYEEKTEEWESKYIVKLE